VEANLHGTKSKTMIGKIVAHYRIIKEIGHGGMGIVYQAEDTKLKRTVALKFLPSELTQDAEAKQRFLHEARAAAAISHASIVTVHEINEHEGRVYIAMEYVEGRTLKELIAVNRSPSTVNRIPIPEVLDIAMQIASGLTAAHAKGIVHRDIKPANIFVTNDDTVKILDFGIAKLAGGETKLTKTGTTLGTAAYMSPEQTSGKDVDQRTDIWSLGVILYEMISGKTPFLGEYMQAMAYSILNEEPKPLGALRPEVPACLANIVVRALAKNPADRYQSMNDLAANLKAAAEGTQPIKARAKRFATSRFSRKALCLSAAVGALAFLLALDIGGIRSQLFAPRDVVPGIVRLAVLPFANLSSDPEQEYFSDGLTHEMIVRLGRLHPQSLSVIARTSVMRYKKGDAPIDQIGRELNVDYVLEGSARREGSRVKVTAELIQVKDQAQLWAETYEREMAGILALQGDVAGRVAEALAIKLLPGERSQLANVRPVNPEAYDACLRGMQLWYRLTPADLDGAQQYFELALQKDPKYAAAHAGIALVWIGRQQLGMSPPSEAAPKARESAQRAIVLDDSIAETHYALAVLKAWTDWDWQGAESEFRRTIEINPGFPDARIYYAHLLANLGRMPEAIEQGEMAVRLDPYNALFHGLFGVVLTMAGRSNEAIAQARLGQKMNPNEMFSAQVLWIELEKKKMDREAAGFVRLVFRLAYNFDMAEALDQGLASGGFREAMRRGADDIEAFARNNFVLPFDIAQICVYTGDNGRTLAWLEKGYEIHDPSMPYLGQWPMLDPLHSEPRFQALLKKMNLPNGRGEK